MNRPLVSIVIVTFDGLPLLKRFLPSVMKSSYPNFEVIVADNASSDGTHSWISERFSDVKVVRHPENWLFCRGNNEASKHAQGKYILLLNNDVEVDPDWLEPLVETAESDETIAAVQPKMLQMDGQNFEYAGAAGGYVDRFGYPFARGRVFDHLERDYGQYDSRDDIFWASGAAVFLRKSAFEEVGRLDEHFEMHMEEVDLCWRFHRAGYRVMFEPDSVVRHLGGSSLPSSHPRKTYYNFRNSLLMLYKNTPPQIWPWTVAQRFSLDMGAATRFLFDEGFEHVQSILKAYRDAHIMRSHYTDHQPALDDYHPLPYQGCIAFDHFLHDRNTVTELPTRHFQAPFAPLG